MIIKKVEIKGENAKIFLDNDSDFTILVETYLNNNILVNDEIDDKKIELLKNQDNQSGARLFLLNKISKKKLSKKECFALLLDFQLSNEYILKIIDEFEKNYLINDVELAEFIVDTSLSNKKGINKIKEKLQERKLSINYDEFLNQYLDVEKYNNNVHYLLEKYTKMGAKKSQKELRNYLSLKMISNGYISSDFIHLIDNYVVDEKEGINKEVKKFFKKEEINKENIAKITRKLLSKGFNYDIIRDVIRECEQDETY